MIGPFGKNGRTDATVKSFSADSSEAIPPSESESDEQLHDLVDDNDNDHDDDDEQLPDLVEIKIKNKIRMRIGVPDRHRNRHSYS